MKVYDLFCHFKNDLKSVVNDSKNNGLKTLSTDSNTKKAIQILSKDVNVT